MSKHNKHSQLTKLTKESPAARKERTSSGIKLRATVFDDKKKREESKNKNTRQLLEENQKDTE